ncbi:MAG: OprO/OprP family phosphate-selective porin [Pseudomonadales bacterium]|nr:OprO/OprP family phosphate-selective porin [Pseudomonadales bacterium]
MKNVLKLKKTALSLCVLSAIAGSNAVANEKQEIEALKKRIEQLEQQLDTRMEAMAEAIEQGQAEASTGSAVRIGGYGEMHYNVLEDDAGEETRELDFHRMVLFFGYDFNDKARFVTEFEVEHIIASSGSRGAVELEQAYLEFDLADGLRLQTGAMLMPIGIINETHEPNTFYGVERPVVETTIIPTTWWSNGIKLAYVQGNGFSYDLMIHEGLKTEDPTSDPNAEPFNIKSGKQKGSFADAYDLAVTGRVRYTGVQGLELAVYGQYQPDLDQSADQSYADDAVLMGGHVIYQMGQFTGKALYARWELGGDEAAFAAKDVQDGGYVELAWEPTEQWGVFVRQSGWILTTDVEAEQTDFGVNYYPYEGIVFKGSYQIQNEEAQLEESGATYIGDGFSLGMGYAF